MPNNVSVENNFIGGLKTEFTGLNFPENACTATSNCVFSLIGDVLRRGGIDAEQNFANVSISGISGGIGGNPLAVWNNYKWNNAGGDGQSQIVVTQIGATLAFFLSSNSTVAAPLSSTLLFGTNLDISQYIPASAQGITGLTQVATTECQFADGNGFLFVFHPFLDPFYVQFTPVAAGGPAIQTGRITVTIRDFFGISPEPGNPAVNFRPTTLTNEHLYNLKNQGWTNSQGWTGTATDSNLTFTGNNVTLPLGAQTFHIPTGLTITNGDPFTINWSVLINYTAVGDGNYAYTDHGTAVGTVTSYTSGTGVLVTNIISSTTTGPGTGSSGINSISNQSFAIASSNVLSTITTWHTAEGNYPSNADIWWEFKDSTGAFNPGTTAAQVPLSSAQAPQGHYLLNAFNQDRTGISGVAGITVLNTNTRPRTGCWFQGRVWYAGVDASQAASGDMNYYTWTENIYFSQIVSSTVDFGSCFQANDPTDNRLFNLLPDDGGVIVIQGTGPIYKLFPIQNGLLVFAANGIWLIRGNSGLGFTADDFSINKISAVQSISGTSIVDVLGLPFFWNQEGIYRVAPSQETGGAPYGFGGLNVEPLTIGTILSFYNNIPFDSKRFVRGVYDPITYVITWIYRSTQENPLTGALVDSRYVFDSTLNLNIFNRAFYPYSLPTTGTTMFLRGIQYVNYPSGVVPPTIKYVICQTSAGNMTFAEERDTTNWVDYFSIDNLGTNYTSFFTTGYKIHGQAFRKWHPIYIELYSNNSIPTQYQLQGIWDFATSGNTGRQTGIQVIKNPNSYTLASGINSPSDISDFGFIARRHRLPGHGLALQINISSVDGEPFHIVGWSIPEQISITA